MNDVIKEIIESNMTKHEKLDALNKIRDDIDIAKDIIAGKFKYCKKCGDYYLSESFITRNETKPTRICTYQEPINSGGNDYADGYADIVYEICPKGHKHEISRKERLK